MEGRVCSKILYPIFGIEWGQDTKHKTTTFIAVAGGGGAAKTGVLNKVVRVQMFIANMLMY